MKVIKKTVICLTALCFCAFIISFSSALTCPSQYNLISNSGFESGTGASADFWRIFEPNPGNEGYRTSNFKFSGNFSMQFDMPVSIYPGGWGQAFIHDAVSVQPNTQYVFSGMIYNNLSHGNAYIDLNDTSFECENRSEKQDYWQKTECIITTSNSASVVYPRVVVDGPDLPLNTGNVWFDNISLVKKDQCIDESLLDFYLDDFAVQNGLICENEPVVTFHTHAVNNIQLRNVSANLYLNNHLSGLLNKLEFPTSGHIGQTVDFGALSPGNYELKIVVDPNSEFNETNENNNFTFNFEVFGEDICNPNGSPNSVSNLHLISRGSDYLLWGWNNPTDSDFLENIIYINGINAVNTSGNSFRATNLSSNTSYTIVVHTKDIGGNINNSNISNTALTLASTPHEEVRVKRQRTVAETEESIQLTSGQTRLNETFVLNMGQAAKPNNYWLPIILLIGVILLTILIALLASNEKKD
jgi:hypothetical protein